VSQHRTFIAIRLPTLPPLLRALGDLRQMGRALKTTAPENLHLTLRFIGPIDTKTLSRVEQMTADVAARYAPFELNVTGTGAFPDRQRPRVIWAGMEGSKPLEALAGAVANGMAGLGLAKDESPFVAHTTLARVRASPPPALSDFFKHRHDEPFGVMKVSQVDVMLSELTARGPVYSVAQSAPLTAAD